MFQTYKLLFVPVLFLSASLLVPHFAKAQPAEILLPFEGGGGGPSTTQQGEVPDGFTNHQGDGPNGRSNQQAAPGQIQNPIGQDNIFELFFAIIREILLPLAVIVAVLAIIFAGFQFIAALGKPEKLTTAKRNFVYVLVGTVLLLGAYGISFIIRDTICAVTDNQPSLLCVDLQSDGTIESSQPFVPPEPF